MNRSVTTRSAGASSSQGRAPSGRRLRRRLPVVVTVTRRLDDACGRVAASLELLLEHVLRPAAARRQ